jgi:hypothetical protein
MPPLFPQPSESIETLTFKAAWNFYLIAQQDGDSFAVVPNQGMGFMQLLGLISYYTTS